MLPKELTLDQQLAPFGFLLFTAEGQSQLSWSVVILLLKTIALRAFPMIRMLEQSAQVRLVWSGRGSPAEKALVSLPA